MTSDFCAFRILVMMLYGSGHTISLPIVKPAVIQVFPSLTPHAFMFMVISKVSVTSYLVLLELCMDY